MENDTYLKHTMELIKKMTTPPAELFDGIEIAEVKSVTPLQIYYNGIILTESFINLSPFCQEFKTEVFKHTHTYNDKNDGDNSSGDRNNVKTSEELKEVVVWRGLKAGDKIALLRTNSSNKFVGLFRIGGLNEL